MNPSPTPCRSVGKCRVRGSTGKALLTAAVVQLFAHTQLLQSARAAGTATAPAVVTVAAQQLLDIDSGQIWSQPYLRIVGGVIEEVRQRQAGEPVTYDLGPVTLLPGLIDCHTHLVGGAGLGPYADLTQTPARAAIEGVANAWLTLQAGFTTVRDLGSRDLADVALRDAIASGRILGPRMLVAVRSLSTTGGHGDWNDLPPDVHVQRENAAIADGVDGVQRAVRQNMKYGADWIKILVTGGVTSAGTSPLQADYTLEEVQAAVTTARARGLDVAAHAHGEEGILRATRAGVRSIEHASFLSDAAIAELRRTGAFIVSNPYTNYYILEQGKNGGYQDYEIEKSRQVYQSKLGSLRRAIRAGIPVAYGTDSGVQPHGTNARQLSIYVEAGMTPLGALQSATLVAARLLRREQTLGRLRRGYVGDLVAVRENPLQNIRTLETPQHVMKDGVLVWSRLPSPSATLDSRAAAQSSAQSTAQSPGRSTAASAPPAVSPSQPRPAAPRPPRPAARPSLPASGAEESVWR